MSVSVVQLEPSGDTTGASDDAAFDNALSSLPHGGVIQLSADVTTPFYTKAGWALPANTGQPPNASGSSPYTEGGPVCLQGLGMPAIMPATTGITVVSMHRNTKYGNPTPEPYELPAGWIRDIVVDANFHAGCTCIEVGDGLFFDVRAFVKNATQGGRGFAVVNRQDYTEKSTFKVVAINCTTHHYLGIDGGDSSQEYNNFDLMVIQKVDSNGRGTYENQDAVVVDGVFLGGDVSTGLTIRGNMALAPSGNAHNSALLKLINSANMRICTLHAKAEINSSGDGTQEPWSVYYDADTSYMRNVEGSLVTELGGSYLNGGQFGFSGPVGFNTDLPCSGYGNAPTASDVWPNNNVFAGFGNTWTNNGPDALVSISGNANSGSIEVNQDYDGKSNVPNGTIFVPAGGEMVVTGSGTITQRLSPARATYYTS